MVLGKIYKIIHSQSEIIYIGSTFNTLRNRWAKHKIQGSTSISKYIQEFGSEQFKIILIKEYEVVDKNHLQMYEQLWINKTKCINIQPSFKIPILEKEKKYSYMKNYRIEYREKNREMLNERDKQYREKNKEIIKKKQTEKIKCSCGKEISKANIAKHLKRILHI
jgi:hypothetical protein